MCICVGPSIDLCSLDVIQIPRSDSGRLSHIPRRKSAARVYIGPFCCLGDVTLEDDVILASHVSVMNGSRQHGIERLDVPIREQPGEYPRVTIGRDSWIGERAIVQADVGQHCVIGAGAVVTEPIADYAVAVGVPAKVIRYRHVDERNVSEFEAVESTLHRIRGTH